LAAEYKIKNTILLSRGKPSFYFNELYFFSGLSFLMLLQETIAFGSMRLCNQYLNYSSNRRILSSGNAGFSE
jgi:hypothetical protein